MAMKDTTPTKEQIAAKQPAVTDELVTFAVAFVSSISDAERAGDINSVQSDILMDMYNSKIAKLLNGRDAGLDLHGKTLNLKNVDDIRSDLAETLARIALLGPEGCEECEKSWAMMLDFKRGINKALIVAQAEAIRKEGTVQVMEGKDTPSALQFMKPEGNA